jgi:hypothetical protein
MNKTINIVHIFFCLALFAQKKKNGEIYIKHPSIDVIYQLHDAMNANDSIVLDKLIADDFKGVSGEQMNPDAEPQTKAEFIQTVKNLHTNSRYFSVKHTDNGYPDAVEYKDESFSNGTWVYSWEYWTAVGATTGIDYSQPRHTQYVVNKRNQIAYSRTYFNQFPYSETWKSQNELIDGRIFSHHENINKVRKFIKAFQFDDDENLFADFSENVRVDAIFNDWDADPMTLDDFKEGIKGFKSNYTIVNMRNVWIKYYEFDAQRNTVQSWWRVEVTRKSDQKNIIFPVMFNHTFNDDGEIVRHFESWDRSKLQ